MGFGMHLTQHLSQSLLLTQEQRLKVSQLSFSLRLQLIQELRNERYEPQASCPKCLRDLTPVEIIKGFNQDPNDFTTCCTKCGHRFAPKLICFGNGTKIEIPFYCDVQTLSQLKGKENLQPEHLQREYSGLYRSAIIHYGCIRRAFEKIGVEYDFEEISDWKSKVTPFLGRMPDTIIADCVDASVTKIRAMRRKLGISRYTSRKALEDEEFA
jgi:hypothetical protein